MMQYLFFCCQSKQLDHPNTICIDDPINFKEEKNDNINCTTQTNNNQINTEEPFKKNNNKESDNHNFFQNNLLLTNNQLFLNENALYNNANSTHPILTINNINNININLNRKSFTKEQTGFLEKNDLQSNYSKKNARKTIVSVDNSRDQYQTKSFLSFSNLTIKYNNNNNNNNAGSSINFSDTEIMSCCELNLYGEIFFNKEIKIDRSGIKNPLPMSTNRYKNKRKSCELRFGVCSPSNNLNNINTHSSTSLINRNFDDKYLASNKSNSQNLNPSNKNNKMVSIKNNQNKKRSISSLNNSNYNKNIVDVMLNLSFAKIQKRINETSRANNNSNNLNNNNNDSIALFTLKYDISQDLFQLISLQDSIPIELLLNYNYPLRFQQNYNFLIGAIKMKMKIVKNERNESILNLAFIFDEEKGDKKGEKNEIVYRFNPFMDKMPITIGRINCDINLNNISVSKLHAQIDYIYDYDEYFIIDCKSTNGTYLLLKSPLNTMYVKRDLYLKLNESKFKIHYINFDN
jgi:hypothetical protein